jgi:hypothetical protein
MHHKIKSNAAAAGLTRELSSVLMMTKNSEKNQVQCRPRGDLKYINFIG